MVREYEDVEPVIVAYYCLNFFVNFFCSNSMLFVDPTKDKTEIEYTYNVGGMTEEQIEQLLRKIALQGQQRTEQYNNNFASRLKVRDIVHKE